MVKSMIESGKKFFGFVIHREKIVNQNIQIVIDDNFDSCVCIFKGFFGEPYTNRSTYSCTKTLNGVDRKKLYDADTFARRYGFRIFVVPFSDDHYTVNLVPGDKIQNYLTKRAFGEEYSEISELYRSIR